MTGPVTPRAVGERVDLDAVPSRVRSWLEAELGGRIGSAVTQVGGMSPGPAARIVLDSGERFFVKAVGAELNPRTPRLFRHELAVLRVLPAVDYRASLVAAYDDGEWVALVLDDVDGGHPDLTDSATLDAVRAVVRAQSRELTPDPVALGVPSLSATVRRWHATVAGAEPGIRTRLPAWWLESEEELLARIWSLSERLPSESWCHLDVRDDNLLRRPDGSVVIVDWGMSRPGPPWVDEVLLDLHDVTSPVFDERVAALPAYGGACDHGRDDAVTDLVLALGISLAVLAHGPAPQGLPRLASFRREESRRLLVGAARRLGVA